jgi:hypothetical protein
VALQASPDTIRGDPQAHQFSPASSAPSRLGPNPGWPSANATIRCSRCGPELVRHPRPATLPRPPRLKPHRSTFSAHR